MKDRFVMGNSISELVDCLKVDTDRECKKFCVNQRVFI
jgi:hypothetical protein